MLCIAGVVPSNIHSVRLRDSTVKMVTMWSKWLVVLGQTFCKSEVDVLTSVWKKKCL
jgi:hypothetical protein